MHVCWKTCPIAYQGAYQRKEKFSTLVLEAITDPNLWFWHAAFGFTGSCNDINILDVSPLHQQFLDGSHSKIDFEFTIDEQGYNKLFYLVDGNIPTIETFQGDHFNPNNKKRENYCWMAGSHMEGYGMYIWGIAKQVAVIGKSCGDMGQGMYSGHG